VTYIEELSGQLRAVGIRGRLHRRILAEFSDHLESEPDASLGDPADLARRFADELGTARARRAGLRCFTALGAAGILCTIAAVALQRTGRSLPQLHPSSTPLADLGLGLIALGAQVALAAGALALLRTVRLRNELVLARREAIFVGRRALVGLAMGLACLVGLALVAAVYQHHLPGWWTALALSAAGLGACGLAAAAPAVVATIRVRPLQSGRAGDLFDDLGPFVPSPLRGRPWLFALLFAAALGGVLAAVGISQNDPFDGLARGALDALACLAGFAVLGPYLGIWRSAAE
jgi:hypothetical protein